MHNGEFDPDKVHGSVDIFLSCMVFEHLENTVIQHIFSLARKKSTASSRYFVLVPAGMQFWGIEDDVAGHLRRYSMDEIAKLSTYLGVGVSHIAGLTYPLSNWLLGLSNFLVARKEGKLLALDQKQRTIESGLRDVEFKTRFPAWTLIFMNELVMMPFFWLQNIFKNSKNSLVLYAEFNILP